MDKAFHELIDRIGAELTSNEVAQIRTTLADLEDLAAGAERDARRMWDEWRSVGGPIGAERLEILAKRSVLKNLLADARRLERHMGTATLQLAGENVRIIPAAEHVTGSNRLYVDDLKAEMSHRDISQAIVDALVAEDGGFYYWPIDVYSDRVVYEASQRGDAVTQSETLYRRSYVVNDDDTVTLGERVEVEKQVSYVEALRIQDGKVKLVRKSE